MSDHHIFNMCANQKHIIITAVVMLLMCGTASAWLSGYDHRVEIRINNTGYALADWQYNFTMDTATEIAAGNMTYADGRDCQATNASDNLLPFWNETVFNISNTRIWVNATSLGNVTNTTNYLYYGKSGASSVANATETFDFYDDFCDEFSITMISEASNPTRTADDAWEGTVLCEHCDFNYSGEYISWYRAGVGGSEAIGYENSTDGITWTAYSGNPILSNAVHSYVVQNGSMFYMFVCDTTHTNLYLYNVSANHTNPVIMNGGNPVYVHSSTASDWDYQIFNMGVTIDSTGKWHMLLEGKSSTSGFRMGYAYSNLTEMDWTAHRSTNYVIDTSGNPDLIYVSERDAILALYGDCTGTWKIVAGYANVSNDLTSSSNWHQASTSQFVIEESGVHIADPSLMGNYNTTYPIMISYNHAQANTSQAYCDKTILQFYDIISRAGYNLSDNWNVIQSSGASLSNGVLTLYKSGTPHTAILSKTYQINDGIIETRVKSTIVDHGIYIWFRRATNTDGDYPRSGGQGGMSLDYDGYEHAIVIDNVNKENTVYTPDANWYYYRLIANGTNLTFNKYSDGGFDAELASVNYVNTSGLTSGYIGFEPWGTTENLLVDWVWVRKYATPEPVSSLGSEESAPSSNDIILGANKYGMLRKNVSSAETFSTIASGFGHDVCFTWWNSTGDNWESYWVGDSYNSALSVPQNDSYLVLMDGTGETVSCSIAAAGTVAIPIGWSCTYLRESTAKTLTAIKSDMGGNCVDLYAWNHAASETGAWTDTGAYSVLPNQGLLVNAST